MATLGQIIQGLQLFEALTNSDETIAAEHDMIYAGPPIEKVPVEMVERLAKLNWQYDESLRCWYHFC